jgi:hypothetical protein
MYLILPLWLLGICVAPQFLENLYSPGLGILLLWMTGELIAASINATACNLIEASQENPRLRIWDSKC